MLVTERTGGPGGAAALAEGIVYLGGGTPIQTACGFEDSLDDMYRYMMAACGPDPDERQDRPLLRGEPGPLRLAGGPRRPLRPDVLRRHLHGADRHRGPRLLRRRGRLPVQRDRRARRPAATWPRRSGRRAGCSCSTWRPPPPGPAPPSRRTPGSTGSSSTTAGSSACRRSGSARRCRCGPARGVVLTAGGFIFNDDMLRRHCPPLVRGTFKVGTEGDDGRGIRMAQAIGAAVRNMYAGEVSLPDHAAAHVDPRHPRQRQGSALHQRGHVHGPGRASPRSTSRTARST